MGVDRCSNIRNKHGMKAGIRRNGNVQQDQNQNQNQKSGKNVEKRGLTVNQGRAAMTN
jgi:hypothetical protein